MILTYKGIKIKLEGSDISIDNRVPEAIKEKLKENIESIKEVLTNDIFTHCRECERFTMEKNSYGVLGWCDFSKGNNFKLYNSELYKCKKKRSK